MKFRNPDCNFFKTYIDFFLPGRVQDHFGFIRLAYIKMACDSNTASRMAKWTDLINLWGGFDLIVFKVIWGNLVYLCRNAT